MSRLVKTRTVTCAGVSSFRYAHYCQKKLQCCEYHRLQKSLIIEALYRMFRDTVAKFQEHVLQVYKSSVMTLQKKSAANFKA